LPLAWRRSSGSKPSSESESTSNANDELPGAVDTAVDEDIAVDDADDVVVVVDDAAVDGAAAVDDAVIDATFSTFAIASR